MRRTLELFSPSRPTLHRPGLAALACILFAMACFIPVATACLPMGLNLAGLSSFQWQHHLSLFTATLTLRDAILIAGALCLSFANLARFAAPPVSPWPRRVFLHATCFYAVLHTATELKTLLTHLPQNTASLPYPALPDRLLLPPHPWYLPVTLIALASASLAVAMGLLYALQLTTHLQDSTLRRTSAFALSATLLITVALLTLHGHALALSHTLAPTLPDFLYSDVLWVVFDFLPLALVCYFVCAARGIRRAARLAPSPH